MSSARSVRPAARRRGGFTLAEVLIVIGIILVLAGLLLAVRSRATDKAAQASCMNNLRQLGMAMTMYAQDNEGAFPFCSPLDQPERKEDWIHWRGTDLVRSINDSALARYVGARNEGYQALMRCPSDEWSHRSNPYPYSYTMSYVMSSDRGKLGPTSPTPRVTSVRRPAEKIILAEENELTINDGLWAPGAGTATAWTIGPDFLSIRHDSKKGEFTSPTLGPMDRRGNVAFVDGHADYVSRKYAHDALHLLPFVD